MFISVDGHTIPVCSVEPRGWGFTENNLLIKSRADRPVALVSLTKKQSIALGNLLLERAEKMEDA